MEAYLNGSNRNNNDSTEKRRMITFRNNILKNHILVTKVLIGITLCSVLFLNQTISANPLVDACIYLQIKALLESDREPFELSSLFLRE